MALKIPSTAQEFAALFERLGEIGQRHDREGQEDCALAIHALMFALGRSQRVQFEAYLSRIELGLTDEQKEHLLSMGIDPDADEQ